jgi:hypothetical protein
MVVPRLRSHRFALLRAPERWPIPKSGSSGVSPALWRHNPFRGALRDHTGLGPIRSSWVHPSSY